jgi:hypothetical protein
MDLMPVAQAKLLRNSRRSLNSSLPPLAASSIMPVPEDKLNNRNLEQLVEEGYSSGKFGAM